MKIEMLILLLVLLLGGVSKAFAGFIVGNGGNVIVCGEGVLRTVELLDHWESRTTRNLNIQMGAPELAPEEKVQLVLERLKKINPNRATLYDHWLKTFMSETDFTNLEIISNADSGPAKITPGCKIVQIAIQQDPDLPGDARYAIQKDLWGSLNSDGKAGLILHELIYRELASQKPAHRTSKYVRYYNAFISSDQITTIKLNDYYNLLLKLQFAVMDTQYGFPIYILTENDDGSLRQLDVRFNEAKPDFVSFAFARASFADFFSHLQYVWHGQALELVDQRCCDPMPIHFNNDGAPVDFSVRAQPLKIDFGSLHGVLTSTQASFFSITDDKDFMKNVSVDGFSDENRFAEIEFVGVYKEQAVQWKRQQLTYDPVKDEVQLRESPSCRACR
ncbi:MAG: hypothetical protein JSU04_16870 [Bdellovibrionales bacterium]|nr:hypothetical protein [Bdellovibrionales bacterium]